MPILSLFRHEQAPTVNRRELSWREFTELKPEVADPLPNGDKPLRTLRAWSPAEYDGPTRSKVVKATIAVVLDFDSITPTQAKTIVANVRAAEVEAVIHTSYRHTLTAPKLRVILPLAEPANDATHRATWRHWREQLAPGIEIDETSQEPSRLYYLPAIPTADTPYQAKYFPGSAVQLVQPPADAPAVRGTKRNERRFSAPQFEALAKLLACHYGRAGKRNRWRVAVINWLIGEGGGDREIADALNDARRAIPEPCEGRWEVDVGQVVAQRERREQSPDAPSVGLPTVIDLSSDPDAAGVACGLWSEGNRPTLQRLKPPKGQDEGPIKKTALNLERILTIDPVFAGSLQYDVVAAEPQWARSVMGIHKSKANAPHEDDQYTALRILVDRRYNVEWPLNIIAEVVLKICKEHLQDAVRDYLTSVKWDRRPRLDTWLERYCGVDPVASALYGARWMIGAAARGLTPGVQVDSMLILAGPQGIGKSSALSILAGPNLFTDGVNPAVQSAKEADENAHRFWICEVSELTNWKKVDFAHLKAFLTKRADSYRAAYARLTHSRPRRYVFCGSVNPDWDSGILPADGDDQRRFWIVNCGKFNLAALTKDRDQLWAEAVARHREGEAHWLATEADRAKHRALIAPCVMVSPIDDLVADWAERNSDSKPRYLGLILFEIHTSPTPANRKGAAIALQRLGWTAVDGKWSPPTAV